MQIIILNKSNSFNLQQGETLNNYKRNLTDKRISGWTIIFR